MIAPEYFNNHVAVEGEIIVKSVPNDAGFVLVWNPTTKKISRRTHAEIAVDLGYWQRYNDPTWNSIRSDKAFAILDSSASEAQNIYSGGILVSNDYSDQSKIPTNGIYSKGNIATLNYGSAVDWALAYNWTQTQGATMNWVTGNFVTLNTSQIITARKSFSGSTSDTYEGAAIEILGNGSTILPSLSFHQPGVFAGVMSYRGDDYGYYFMSANADAFRWLNALGYRKSGSNDDFVLTGGGGHKSVSDFALATDLTGYVTTNTEQHINAIKTFRGGIGNTYDTNALRIDGNGSTIYPTLSLHQPGSYAGTLSYRGDGFHFMDNLGTGYSPVISSGFFKNGSSDSRILLGGGGDKAISDFATTADLNDFVTINTPQTIIANKTFASTSEVRFLGVDRNHVNVFKYTTGNAGIVSGHEYTHYDTRWKVGNKRGGNDDNLGYAFQFSSNDGATYDEKVLFTPDGNILTSVFGAASDWNSKVSQSQLVNYWSKAELPDYRNYGLGTINPAYAYDLDNVSHTSILDINDLTINKPFTYGSVWTHRKSSTEFTQISVEVFSGQLYTRGWSTGSGDTGWRKHWDNVNLPNPASISQLDTKVNKSGDIMTGVLDLKSGLKLSDSNSPQDWSIYQTTSGINFYVTGGSTQGDVIKFDQDGTITTLLTGSSDLWYTAYQNGLVNRGAAFVSNVDANNLGNQQSAIVSIELGNGTGNTNFPVNNDYGTFMKMTSKSFTSEFFHQNNGDLYHRNWYLGSNPQTTPFRKIYDNINLPNPATQSQLNNYLPLSGGTLTGGGRINAQGTIRIQQEPTYNATGLFWEKMDDSDIMAGIGSLTTGDTLHGVYMGWGEFPWTPQNSLSVATDYFRYKGYDVWHSNNLPQANVDYLAYLLSVGAATIGYVDNNFLKLSGGTLTGTLNLNGASNHLQFSENGVGKWHIESLGGEFNLVETGVAQRFRISPNASTPTYNGYGLWHSGNFNPDNYQPIGQYVRVGGTGTIGSNISFGWTGSELQATVDITTIGNLWHTGNFNPNTKANGQENAKAIGFSSGSLPTSNGVEYPYMYYDNGLTTAYIALATQDFVSTNFHKINPSGSLTNASDSNTNRSFFDYNWAGTGYAGSVINFSGLNGNYSTELFSDYTSNTKIGIRTHNGDAVNAWTSPRWLWHDGNFNPASYVTQSSLNTQLANYATLDGVQTFSNTNTFQQSPVIPDATIGVHAVNLNQLLDVAPPYYWNYVGQPAIVNRRVLREMTWNNYGNGHTIFDISSSTTPWGASKSNVDAEQPWSPSYPTLVGGNGSGTYGVRVDSARNADNLGGIPAGNYATQTWVNTNFIPKSHPVYNITQANINSWNAAAGGSSHTHSNLFYLDNIDQYLGTGQAPQFGSIKLMDSLGYGLLALEEGFIGGEIGLVDTSNKRFYAGRINEYLKYGSSIDGFEGLNIHFDTQLFGIGREIGNSEDKVQLAGDLSVDTVDINHSSRQLILNPLYNTDGDVRGSRNAHIYIVTGNSVRLPSKPILGQRIEIFNESDSNIEVIHDNVGLLFYIPGFYKLTGIVGARGFIFDEKPLPAKKYDV